MYMYMAILKHFLNGKMPSNTANIIVFSQAYLVIFHKSNVPSELTVVDVEIRALKLVWGKRPNAKKEIYSLPWPPYVFYLLSPTLSMSNDPTSILFFCFCLTMKMVMVLEAMITHPIKAVLMPHLPLNLYLPTLLPIKRNTNRF